MMVAVEVAAVMAVVMAGEMAGEMAGAMPARKLGKSLQNPHHPGAMPRP